MGSENKSFGRHELESYDHRDFILTYTELEIEFLRKELASKS